MDIVVTGGAGFIGSAVVRKAIGQGHKVLNIDNLSYAANLRNVESVIDSEKYSFKKIDIINTQELDACIRDFRPDLVMHLAAESHVDNSILAPKRFLETNIMGTFNLLEICRKYIATGLLKSDFKFLHVSTDEVYGSLGSTGAFTEKTAYSPNSPYSASKAASDHIVQSWCETYKFPAVITNCSNNYGPCQYPEKLIPVVIESVLNNQPIPVYGDGKNVRDWLHVDDHVDALFAVADKASIGSSYNIGGNNEVSNIELVEIICKIMDRKLKRSSTSSELIHYVEDRKGHDKRYAINAEKIWREIGWEPKIKFIDGIEKTVEWYLTHKNWWSQNAT